MGRTIGIRAIPIHPLLAALFPPVFLYAHAGAAASAASLAVPVARTLLFAMAAWAALAIAMRDWRKAAVPVTVAAILLGSCGRISDAVMAAGAPRFLGPFCRELVLALCAAVVLAVEYLVATTRRPLVDLTAVLNLSAFVLLALPAGTVAQRWLVRKPQPVQARPAAVQPANRISWSRPGPPRSIYYIVLDSYGRADMLADLYGLDNSEEMDFLTSRGFYVAEKSRCNYPYTDLSLGSSLNMTHLDANFTDAVLHSSVADTLKSAGYRFVLVCAKQDVAGADLRLMQAGRGDFEKAVANLGAASAAESREMKRRETLQAFEHLPDAAEMEGPSFVFAHIMVPHPPFAFAQDGGDVPQERFSGAGDGADFVNRHGFSRSEYVRLYRGQLLYTNVLLNHAIDRILAASAVDPIIVVQGDHGGDAYLHRSCLEASYLADRMSILNALRLPDGPASLQPSMTPVNTFRIILNHYFGTRLPLLGDDCWYMSWQCPGILTRVTQLIDGPGDRRMREVLKGMEYFYSDEQSAALRAEAEAQPAPPEPPPLTQSGATSGYVRVPLAWGGALRYIGCAS